MNIQDKIKEMYHECCQALVDDSEWTVACNGVNSSEAYVVMKEVYRIVIGEEPPDAYDLCEPQE